MDSYNLVHFTSFILNPFFPKRAYLTTLFLMRFITSLLVVVCCETSDTPFFLQMKLMGKFPSRIWQVTADLIPSVNNLLGNRKGMMLGGAGKNTQRHIINYSLDKSSKQSFFFQAHMVLFPIRKVRRSTLYSGLENALHDF